MPAGTQPPPPLTPQQSAERAAHAFAQNVELLVNTRAEAFPDETSVRDHFGELACPRVVDGDTDHPGGVVGQWHKIDMMRKQVPDPHDEKVWGGVGTFKFETSNVHIDPAGSRGTFTMVMRGKGAEQERGTLALMKRGDGNWEVC